MDCLCELIRPSSIRLQGVPSEFALIQVKLCFECQCFHHEELCVRRFGDERVCVRPAVVGVHIAEHLARPDDPDGD